MANPEDDASLATNQLAAIPFGTLIGGPLIAAVEAQAKAAMTTVDFINAVGFEEDTANKAKKVKTVAFSFMSGPANNGQTPMMKLEVPLLSIVPIPFLRIENLDIHFKASLSQSMETKQADSSSLAGEFGVKASGGYLAVKAEMNASISSKKDSSSTRDSRYSVEYTMDINVHAVQDDIPAGLAKVLGMLSESLDRQLQARPTIVNVANPN
jgi:hypothetical protein